jgi:anaerobic selenocysteine-containing dehydrogenase
MCGLEIKTEGDAVSSIRGDKQDVYSKGHICPKAVALEDIHTDPNRLRQPMRRTASGWEPISWEAALDEVATQIIRLQKKYGRDAVGIYTGNPTVHNTGTILYLYDFMNAIGTRNRFASHSLDQLPQMFVNGELWGHQAMFPVPDLERTQYLLILGANPLVSNGSIMSTPDIAGKFKSLQARGGKIVVIDPRRTPTAQVADTYLPIRPGTDVLFLLALVHILFAEKLVKNVAPYIDGVAALEKLVAPYQPEKAAAICGISAADMYLIAREFAAAPSAIAYGRLGVATQEFGGLCNWLLYAINILTGNFDRPGGLMFTLPAIDFLTLLKKEAKALRWFSRIRRLPEVAGDLPTATMADEILTPGEGQIKGMVTVAGNPVLSAPNGPKVDQALSQLEFMVSIDLYLNETTRHAHLILPPAAGLEVLHYDFVLAIIAIRNVANFSPAVFEKPATARYDWEILFGLQQRLERQKNGLFVVLKHAVMAQLTPERRLDLAMRIGPHGVWGGRLFSKTGLSLRRLKAQPHGIDLGALTSVLPKRIFTPNKRINLVPENITAQLPKVEALYIPDTGEVGKFRLFGRRQLHTNNSWMHGYARLMKRGDTCTALIHPQDAQLHGVANGEVIRVCSEVGQVDIKAEVSAEVMPGTLCIPHGWGHVFADTQLGLAQIHPGVNVNALTDDRLVDGMTGNAVFNGVWVSIEKK